MWITIIISKEGGTILNLPIQDVPSYTRSRPAWFHPSQFEKSGEGGKKRGERGKEGGGEREWEEGREKEEGGWKRRRAGWK